MDSRVVTLDEKEVLRAQNDVVLLDDLALLKRAGDAQPLGRRTDDGRGFQEDDLILLVDIVAMDRNQVIWRFSTKDAHGTRSIRNTKQDNRTTKVAI